MYGIFLIEPNKNYQKSFEKYVLAYRKTNDKCYLNLYIKALDNFDEYLKELHNQSKGIDLPKGWVITSTFWLIDNNEVVGVVRIRHEEIECSGHIGYDISPCYRNKGYGTQILKLALERALKIGLMVVIAICNIDNIASKKIIEKNNGELLGNIFDEEDNENLYKYNITTTTNKI